MQTNILSEELNKRNIAFGTVGAISEMLGGFATGAAGRAFISGLQLAEYCGGSGSADKMYCCVERVGCTMGLCRACQPIQCAPGRRIQVVPKMQASLLVDPTGQVIRMEGNIGTVS